MFLDITIGVIILYTMVQGYRHGFVHTFFQVAGWIVSIVLGFALYPKITEFLKDKTNFYDFVQGSIAGKILGEASAPTGKLIENLPSMLKEAVNSATNTLAISVSDGLSNIIFNIIGFLAILIIIRFAFFLLTTLFSKKSNDGIIGGIDGLLGLLVGGIKGMVVVFILLALLVPITSLWGNPFLLDSLGGSYIAKDLYDNNLIFLIATDFL